MGQRTNKGGNPIPNGPSTVPGHKSGSGRGNNPPKSK